MLLGAVGICNRMLACLGAFGLCSLFGLPYGPMHSIIPCLVIGLGVDDVFVIVQAYDNVEMELKGIAQIPYIIHYHLLQYYAMFFQIRMTMRPNL